MTIKTFAIEYDAINSKNTFTNGDTINGRVIVEASKTTTVKSLVFIATGEARVKWSEQYGDHHHVYWSNEKYYDIKHHILSEKRKDGTEVIGKGRHEFPFSFSIPDGKFPSSLKTNIGNIVHKLKAELKQSMKLTKKAKTHFTFVSKADMGIPGLMDPQHGCKDKSVGVFGSGNVSMDVHTQRMGFKQGEAIQLTVKVSNNSTRSVKPKFVLYEKKSFFAQGHRKISINEILKEKMESIASSGKETVSTLITVPWELPPSILNCSIITQEYKLKIHLKLKYARNPEIKLPIVILPSSEVLAENPPPAAAAAAFGFEAFGNPDKVPWSMPPPSQPASQAAEPPPACGAQAMYPYASGL
ncbi:uncharacterized protein ACO6RY_05127 [Pungitius sinensis]